MAKVRKYMMMDDVEMLRNKLPGLIRRHKQIRDKLWAYCHDPECSLHDECPERHPKCKGKLDLDTSIAWQAAKAVNSCTIDLGSLLFQKCTVKRLKIDLFCLDFPKKNTSNKCKALGTLMGVLFPHESKYDSVYSLVLDAADILQAQSATLRSISLTHGRKRKRP